MGSLKWIVALFGLISGGPLGALVGFILGSMADRGLDAARHFGRNSTSSGHSGTYGGYRYYDYSTFQQDNSYKSTESAYKELEIASDATDEEVKSAYRRLAMKHHPDKVASLGEDARKAAEIKFRKIQEAYETIKKQRGIN